jgi:PAS domain S-box-containing protein
MSGSAVNRRSSANVRDLRRVEHAVARILAETERPVEVYDAALEAIGRPLGWQLAGVWELDAADGRLHCACTWHAGTRTEEFEELSAALALSPGEGLPGRVLSSGQPAWLTDAPVDANFPRAAAARRSGLHAGFGFPLRSARGGVGVMEFFAEQLREPDERLLATMAALGSQVGQFVSRLRAEEEVRARESRLTAMLEAALDAVVTMDAEGRVVGWNAAAERIFGYEANAAIGREMAELIVPPAARAPSPRIRSVRAQRSRPGPRSPVGADRASQRRQRVPGGADDHEDRRPGAADVHRVPARHHRSRRSRSGTA